MGELCTVEHLDLHKPRFGPHLIDICKMDRLETAALYGRPCILSSSYKESGLRVYKMEHVRIFVFDFWKISIFPYLLNPSVVCLLVSLLFPGLVSTELAKKLGKQVHMELTKWSRWWRRTRSLYSRRHLAVSASLEFARDLRPRRLKEWPQHLRSHLWTRSCARARNGRAPYSRHVRTKV